MAAGDRLTCNFTNTKLATIIVTKTTVGGTGSFTYTGGGTGVTPSFSLTTATAGTAVSTSFTNLAPGSYGPFIETVPAAWAGNTTNVACTVTAAGDGTTSTSGGTTGVVAAGGTITSPTITHLGAGATLTCSFYNSALPTLRVVKNVTGSGSGTFSFAVTGAYANPSISIGPLTPPATGYWPGPGAIPSTVIPIGASTVSEVNQPAGWTLTDSGCNVAT